MGHEDCFSLGGTREAAMRQKHKKARQAGFSMIELMIVVAIIVALAAVAYPNVGRYIRVYRLNGGTEDVVTDIQRARMMAVSKNANYGVLFVVLSQNTYRWVIEDLQLTGTTTMPADVYAGIRLTFARATTADLAGVQAGPIHTLPPNIQFAPGGCGIAGTADTARFSRLGMLCRPGDPGCPAVAAGGYGAIAFGGAGMQLCLRDTAQNLSRLVRVSPGGRVSGGIVL